MLYFTADTHFGHRRMLDYRRNEGREFSAPWEMDEKLIKNWNEVVSDKDEVWHLGDFSFANWNRTVEIFEQLRGHKHLVYGNHDKANRNKYKELFESVQDYKHLVVQGSRWGGSNKIEIMLLHYPMWRWNKQRYGTIHCHGHIHNKTPFTDFNIKRVDVGVDAWEYYPASIEKIVEITEYCSTPYHHD